MFLHGQLNIHWYLTACTLGHVTNPVVFNIDHSYVWLFQSQLLLRTFFLEIWINYYVLPLNTGQVLMGF